MTKRRTLASEFIQQECVIPSRKKKIKALKEENYFEFFIQSFVEERCKNLRENLK